MNSTAPEEVSAIVHNRVFSVEKDLLLV